MQKLLTVVVPIYKVEKYINKCLDSLIVPNEQMKMLEVICVNDGTPDNSANMAREYEKRYPETFRVVDKENGGHGSAWNKGVELATGKYLRFLDSDDWLTNFSAFIDKLENFDVDLIFTGKRWSFEELNNDKEFMFIGMTPEKVYDVETYDWDLTNEMYARYSITNFHTCTYKTSVIKKYHPVFLEKMYYDDQILFVLPLLSSKTFVYFDLILYNYLLGREGQTADPKVIGRNIDFFIKTRKYCVDFCNKHPSRSENINKRIHYILSSRNYNTYILMCSLNYKDSIKKMAELTKWLNIAYPSFKGGRLYFIYRISPSLFWLIQRMIVLIKQ